ncbi:argininosuccinate lyase [Halobacterium salinarum]|uniref:Argininosuccinate lyase n=2 Tax=Halobacterium salinarum TaxID=2242 RepID=A0A4D6GQG6_HALS9|nr:argininosuccinate lyase [Halobacterium salinarum]QCC43771.1 argininosuccinate lyase [Halobacterium salinarum]TYO82268.1 argininosuccinate lyase [Halobacterium salinarum DSM 3754]
MTGGGDPVVRRDRFSGGPARSFLSSMDGDGRIFEADLAVDRAHVVMLAEQDIIGDEAAAAILGALADVEAAGFDALPPGEDVHEAIETAVVEAVGRDGGKLHTARSRNDEVAACIRYRLRADLLDAVEAVVALRSALADVAAAEAETVMPGFTHLQPAQPTTVAHWALSYAGTLARDTGRLCDAYGRTNESPLGAAAFAGTTFGVDRERTAALLGFDGVVANAADAAASRDFLLEAVSALASVAVTCSGLAADVVFFANRGFVEVSDDYASTSSIMPQKKNPDTMELVRATAGDAVGAQQALATTLQGLPRAYNRDLQRATGHAWTAVDGVTSAVEVAAGVVATAGWPADDLEAAAGEGFSTATGVADALAAGGLPFRTAHEVVALAAERGGEGATLDAVAAATEAVTGEPLSAVVEPAAVADALDPVESVAARDSAGGPAPAAVEAAVADVRDGIDADEAALAAERASLADAADALAAEVSGYV